MSQTGKKKRKDRLHRAQELVGVVRNALPCEFWSDETCGNLAAKLWSLGYNSVERLRMYLFSNCVNIAPYKDLFAMLATAQCDDVHDGKLSGTCKPYLLYEWQGMEVDFLDLVAYVRSVYDDDNTTTQGVGTAASSTILGSAPATEQLTAASASPLSVQGIVEGMEQGPSTFRTDRTVGKDIDEGERPTKKTKVDARHLERHNYTRRSLRRVADDMKWSGKEAFFKFLSYD
jgi:hypothetical protein